MYIGEVAKKTGLSVKAIRLYEEKKLIKPPARHGKYRVYSNSDVEVLTLIKEAKSLGVTLARLQGVIVYHDQGVDWGRIYSFLEALKSEQQEKIAILTSNIKKIEHCMSEISSCSKST